MSEIDPSAMAGGHSRRELERTASIALGAVLVYVVAHAALLSRFPWFVDETYFATLAQAAQGDPAQRFGVLIDHKGLLSSWIAAFLIHFDVPPMTAMRLISIVSGAIGSLAGGYVVWRWLGSPRLALVTGLLVAFIPYMFVNDSVGVYDAFVAAFSMLALALQLELARRQRLDVALLLGMTVGALLLTKPTGELAIVLWPVSLLMFDWRRIRRWRRLAAWAGLAIVALVIAFAMYGLTRLSPLGYSPDPANHRTISDALHHPLAKIDSVARPALDAMWGYLTPPGFILALWGGVRVVVTRNRLGIIALIWALAAIVAFLVLTESAYPRYGLQAIPPLCILIAIGSVDLWDRARTRVALPWVALVAALASAPMLLLDGQVLASPTTAPYAGLDRDQYVTLISNREPVREAAEIILKRAPKHLTISAPVAQRSVADLNGYSFTVLLVLNGTHYTTTSPWAYMDATSDRRLVNKARFVIVEGAAPDWLKVGGAKLVKRWSRAGGGPPVVLYDRTP